MSKSAKWDLIIQLEVAISALKSQRGWRRNALLAILRMERDTLLGEVRVRPAYDWPEGVR